MAGDRNSLNRSSNRADTETKTNIIVMLQVSRVLPAHHQMLLLHIMKMMKIPQLLRIWMRT